MAIRNSRKIGIPMVNLRLGGGVPADERFIILVKTDNAGTSNNDQFTLPWTGDYDVEWGDGVTDTGQSGSTTHTYSAAGTYEIAVTPTNQCKIFFNNGGDRLKLLEIKNWGIGTWSAGGLSGAFNGCNVMDVTATDTPDLSVIVNASSMFRNCFVMVGNSSFANWDTSNIKRPENMFRAAKLFNQNISSWDTSSFIRADNMLFDAEVFNHSIEGWDMSNATNISNMLRDTIAFDQSLANWDITSITNATNLFLNSGISTANYDATLIGWAAQSITNVVSVNFGNSQYTLGGAAEAARTTLISTYGWTIVDGGGI